MDMRCLLLPSRAYSSAYIFEHKHLDRTLQLACKLSATQLQTMHISWCTCIIIPTFDSSASDVLDYTLQQL